MTSGRCSELSLDAGESLAATATTAERWLLVEVPGIWPRDVSAGDGLPTLAQSAVTAWLERTASARLLFIRRPGRAPTRSLAFVVRAAASTIEVRRLELEHSGDLAHLDLDADGDWTDQQLVLVCGHGTRDSCCARRGVAVYGALAARLDGDEQLWVSSHQGGHRFAANVLVLPAGLQFGRVEPDEAPLVVAQALSGRIELDRYRGRTSYPPVAQAAERAVREALELRDVADLSLAAVEDQLVRFRLRDGSECEAIVDETVGPSVPVSCGLEPEPQKVFGVRLL